MKNNVNWNFDNSYSRLSDAFKEHIDPVAVNAESPLLRINDCRADINSLKITDEDKKRSNATGRCH